MATRFMARELKGGSNIDDDNIENTWRSRKCVFWRVLYCLIFKLLPLPHKVIGWKVGVFNRTCFSWYKKRSSRNHIDLVIECDVLFPSEDYNVSPPIKPILKLTPNFNLVEAFADKQIYNERLKHIWNSCFTKIFDVAHIPHDCQDIKEMIEHVLSGINTLAECISTKYDGYGLGALHPRIDSGYPIAVNLKWPYCINAKRENALSHTDPIDTYDALLRFVKVLSDDIPLDVVEKYYKDGLKPIVVQIIMKLPLVLVQEHIDTYVTAQVNNMGFELSRWARDTYWRVYIQFGNYVFAGKRWILKISHNGNWNVDMIDHNDDPVASEGDYEIADGYGL